MRDEEEEVGSEDEDEDMEGERARLGKGHKCELAVQFLQLAPKNALNLTGSLEPLRPPPQTPLFPPRF